MRNGEKVGNCEWVYEFEEGGENCVLDNSSLHSSIFCVYADNFHTNRFSDSMKNFLSERECPANGIDSISSFLSSFSEVDRHFDAVVEFDEDGPIGESIHSSIESPSDLV